MSIIAAQNGNASKGNNLAKFVPYNENILEKVILKNDLSDLTPVERVMHVKAMCESLGLNPLTNPIQLIEFKRDGKTKIMAYVAKDGTEQLRKKHNVSITGIETKTIDGIYVVTAHSSMSDGRMDASTGAVNIAGMKGDYLCNAMMKAETKAKRRATLSICGLGLLDESEIDTIPGARRINNTVSIAQDQVLTPTMIEEKADIKSINIEDMVLDVSQVSTMAELEEIYRKHYRTCAESRDAEALKNLIIAKDAKKIEIGRREFLAEMDEENERQKIEG